MSEAASNRTVPKGAIIGAAALIGFALVAASIGRMTGVGTVRADYAGTLQTASFRFADRSDGGISVIAPETGATIGVVPAGTDGFVRTVLRSLAFDRQRHGIGAEPAFVIAKWSDGHSTIDDPTTGRRVDLAAFGAVNMEAFEHLVAMRGRQIMNPLRKSGPRRFDVGCTIDVEQTGESLHAHVSLDDNVQIQPGDEVTIHGAPVRIAFGDTVSLRRTATVVRANALKRLMTHVAGYLELTELYEVSFSDGRAS